MARAARHAWRVCGVMACAAWASAAYADCTSPATDAERAQCIGHDLRDSDAVINTTYGQVHFRLSPEGQADLRRQELAWIKARAQTCQVDIREPDREKWLAHLLTDYSKTVCVVRFTERRTAELRAQLAALVRPAPDAPRSSLPGLAAPGEPAGPSGAGDVFELDAPRSVTSGKWYFEAALDRGAIARAASASIFVGVKTPNVGAIGTLQTMHPRNVYDLPVNIGVAVDLDDGKLYIRVNGAWRGLPGSAGGLDVKLGRMYQFVMTSSVPLGPFLDSGAVQVNFGQHGFVYALPDGYIPLGTEPARRVVEQAGP